MSKQYDVIVIGSGPAGLSCSITLARDGKSVVLLERNDKFAKKIYATGNGRCNFLNTKAENANKVLEFCSSCGIVPIEEEDGRLYPRNKEAASVANCLLASAKAAGVFLVSDFEVVSVQKNEQGFVVKSKLGEEYSSSSVVIATGGKAGIQFGCYGDGYKWASDFGHQVKKPIPALCGVEVEEDLGVLAGVRVSAKASIFCDNKLLAKDLGEVQFTKAAISGICVMNLARCIRKTEGTEFKLVLDMYPEYSEEELLKLFMNQKEKVGCAMEGLVPEGMHNYLHTRISKDEHSPKTMAALSKNLSFTVTGTKGWKDAQVTCGGVEFKELDENYQSKLQNGLYFAGEILDYDGPCGGYNIGFAIASGMKVGKAIK